MKSINKILILSVLLTLFACGSQKNNFQKSFDNKVIFKINIDNYTGDKAVFTSADNTKKFKVKKIKDGVFFDTLQMPEGYYKLSIGKEYTNTYIKPGDKLTVSLDAKQFDETIKYEGIGAEENNYLAKKLLLNEKINGRDKIMSLNKLNEKDFLKKWDSIIEALQQNLTLANIKDANFVNIENKSINIYKAIGLVQYPRYHKYITHDNKFKVSDTYPDVRKLVNFNDENLLKLDLFINLLGMHFSEQSSKIAQEKKEYDPILILQIIDKQLSNQKIKEILVTQTAKYDIGRTKKLEEYYQLFKKLVSDKKLQEPITETYNNLKNVKPGTHSPDFKAFDINGKEYHLKDFAGKLLYIDLWATWCAPCRAEIPHLEKLKKEYKDKGITFLSIDVWDKKDRWEKMVKAGKVTGWQLISTDKKMDFLQKYVVWGIPRFIFLDKDGTIISYDAIRPSNQQLKTLINKHLNNK